MVLKLNVPLELIRRSQGLLSVCFVQVAMLALQVVWLLVIKVNFQFLEIRPAVKTALKDMLAREKRLVILIYQNLDAKMDIIATLLGQRMQFFLHHMLSIALLESFITAHKAFTI